MTLEEKLKQLDADVAAGRCTPGFAITVAAKIGLEEADHQGARRYSDLQASTRATIAKLEDAHRAELRRRVRCGTAETVAALIDGVAKALGVRIDLTDRDFGDLGGEIGALRVSESVTPGFYGEVTT